jgi:sarcosine/dimethylglycine N-methyltransferase
MGQEEKLPTSGEHVDKTTLHYGRTGIDQLYARVWGDSIQFGFYDSPATDLEAAVVETKRRMLSAACLGAHAHVLEVGSGWGATARYLARAAGLKVTATNVEDDHLVVGRTLAVLSGVGSLVTNEYADFQDLPFVDQMFDAWWAQEATVHATDKPMMFSEAWRVLKPGGRIVFTDQITRVANCTEDDLARICARHGSDDAFDTEGFVGALADAGFKDIDTQDWSVHMNRHFTNLVIRLEQTYDRLIDDIPEAVVDFNLNMWRFGRDLSAKGGMGWVCFTATKPT